VELLSVSANENGPSQAFGVPAVAIMARRPSPKGRDNKNIIAAMAVDPSLATTLQPVRTRSIAPQAIDLQYVSGLPTRYQLASLSRGGVFRARTGTRSWRDRDVQKPKSFVWSSTRPANRLCLRRRSPIHASSIWSGCWRDRPHGTSFKLKQTTGRETASRSKEVTT
jgi:hypothetical protein